MSAVFENPIVQAFLTRRGVTRDELAVIQRPEASHQHDPFLLDNMVAMVDRLHDLKQSGARITIDPDYDADGVLSGTLASVAFYLFDFEHVNVYHPRLRDGYGMTPKAVDRILAQFPDTEVLFTTDNGSNAHEGIAYAKSLGLEVLVTDHHLASRDPQADVVVNPNRTHVSQAYPYKSISGTAVAYKVFEAYNVRHGNLSPAQEAAFKSLLLLVGISTVTDVMPMRDENRYFVQEAIRLLERFSQTHTPSRVGQYDDTPLGQYHRGLDLLVYSMNQRGKLGYGVDASTFGFLIGPLLNSPRRMSGFSSESFALFETMREAVLGATPVLPSEHLFDVNEARKQYVSSLSQALLAEISASPDPVEMTVFTAQMQSGVAGLLAGEFTTATDLPVLAFGVYETHDTALIHARPTSDVVLKGSGRAPSWFDLHATLTRLSKRYPDLFVKFGGHQAAAGVSVKASQLPRLQMLFANEVKTALETRQDTTSGGSGRRLPFTVPGEFLLINDTARQALAGYDGEVHFTPLDMQFEHGSDLQEALAFFEAAAPFGEGFDAPTFTLAFTKADVTGTRIMGKDANHVKLSLDGAGGLQVIRWKGADWYEQLAPTTLVSVTGELGYNEFRGEKTPQFIVKRVVEHA